MCPEALQLMIYRIFKQLADISFLRDSPESLPYHHGALAIVLILNFAWRFVGVLGELGPLWSSYIALVPMILMAILLQLLLKARSQEERFLKMYFALQGTAVFVGMMSWSMFMLLTAIQGGQFIFILASFWQILIVGHIFQKGCELTKWQGIGIGFLFMMTVVFFSIPVFSLLGGIHADGSLVQ
ncbi:MAG: hypothetical protein CMF48_04690 [Legionellales bacterium]|nr:hypothetical protein [Legionellales bacterium]|tara:strand:- start:68 stop:619 length:552 start_codon:yes stop_codon:yes gene_type:complete